MNARRFPTVREMVAMCDAELSRVDPVVMNLVVAQGIPALENLDIGHYVQMADEWSRDLAARASVLEAEFHQTPQDWNNDFALFQLGLICWYVDVIRQVAYREDQRDVVRILYTNPSDLFLNGVLDSGRGTCASLAILHVVVGRRIGLPVSLACAGSHYLCRYDDGLVTHNIEATDTGRGGFSSQTDDYILNKHKLPRVAKDCGSDLRAVTPHEMLGLFLGCRARHLENTLRLAEAEPDYLLARYLFPRNRCLYEAQNRISIHCSMGLFEPGERGHPTELANWLQEVVRDAPWPRKNIPRSQPKEVHNGSYLDEALLALIDEA